MYFNPKTWLRACTVHLPEPTRFVMLVFACAMKVLRALFVWNPSAFPPYPQVHQIDENSKSRIPATKKVTKLMMRRLSMTNPLTKAMMLMMMTKEGTNCLNSKIHGSCDIRVKNRCYSCSFCNCVWRDRSRQCSIQYFRAEGHLSCFIPGP